LPTIRRDASKAEERAPFGVYDGPEPPDATYHGVIRTATLRTSKQGNDYLNFLVSLDAAPDSSKAQYNGFAAWTKVTLDGSDAGLSRERSTYMAIAGKPEVAILTDDSKPDPKVTKIGGVNPIGVRVLVQVKDDNDGYGPSGRWIYADGDAPKAAPAQTDDDDETVEAEAKTKSNVTSMRGRAAKKAAAPEPEPEPRAETAPDHHSMTLPQLRAYAKEQGIESAGQGKKALLEALDAKLTGSTGQKAETKLNPQDIKKMSEKELIDFLETENEAGDSYSKDDFGATEDGKIDRDEVIEILVDDGVILPF
jgi:pyruvate/2-oxoglutarate dehydrogenase complex dihydrolipoamide acyltransferase (E2) component